MRLGNYNQYNNILCQQQECEECHVCPTSLGSPLPVMIKDSLLK